MVKIQEFMERNGIRNQIEELFGDDIAALVSYGNMTEDEFDSKVKASIVRIFSR